MIKPKFNNFAPGNLYPPLDFSVGPILEPYSDFFNILIFCALRVQIFNYFISVKYCPIITNHTSMKKYCLFSFEMMYKS